MRKVSGTANTIATVMGSSPIGGTAEFTILSSNLTVKTDVGALPIKCFKVTKPDHKA